MRPEPLEARRLGPKEVIDDGAFGTVYRLESFTLPGFSELAYKEFLTAPSAEEVDNLRALIAFRDGLGPAERAVIDEQAAWPLQLVTERGVVRGSVMRLIPPVFFGTQVLPSGRVVRLPVKAQWLVVDTDRADAAGIAVPPADDIPARLVLCAKLAHVLGVLHRGGHVYGDLSLNNVMFAVGAPPQIMVVDCDAVQSPTAAPIPQGHTDDWLPPEAARGQHRQSVHSDLYKLALFILRTLTPGPHASQSVDPNRVVGVLDLAGNTLMRAGLSDDPNARPTAKEWFDYLTDYLRQLTSPPEFLYADTNCSAALIGTTVGVSWQVTGAQRISITTADGHRVSVDAASGEHRVSVTRSGPITLRAENRYGAADIETDPVIVVELPAICRVEVPAAPALSFDIGEDRLAAGLTAVQDVPVIPTGAITVPDFEPLRALAANPLPEVVAQPSATVTALGGLAAGLPELLAALSADGRRVVARAVAASAAAAATAGESVVDA